MSKHYQDGIYQKKWFYKVVINDENLKDKFMFNFEK